MVFISATLNPQQSSSCSAPVNEQPSAWTQSLFSRLSETAVLCETAYCFLFVLLFRMKGVGFRRICHHTTPDLWRISACSPRALILLLRTEAEAPSPAVLASRLISLRRCVPGPGRLARSRALRSDTFWRRRQSQGATVRHRESKSRWALCFPLLCICTDFRPRNHDRNVLGADCSTGSDCKVDFQRSVKCSMPTVQ